VCWFNGQLNDEKITFTKLMTQIETQNVAINVAKRGDTIQVSTLTFTVLNPEELVTDPNSNSLVLSLDYGQTEFLFMGDADQKAEQEILDMLHDIDILKVGHHGSKSSSSTEFLNIVKPEIAIIMVGEYHIYSHPSEETIGALNDINATIYKTIDNGTIIITTDGMIYSLQTQR
jgi:competence protein ComEC